MNDTRYRTEASAARNCARVPHKVNPAHKLIVEAGGGVYEPGMLCNLVMFDSPDTGSTLAIPENELTPDNIREKIRLSNLQYGIV